MSIEKPVSEAATKLAALIKDFDLPDFRRDVFRPANLQWLDKKMAERNSNKPRYEEARALLTKCLLEHNVIHRSVASRVLRGTTDANLRG